MARKVHSLRGAASYNHESSDSPPSATSISSSLCCSVGMQLSRLWLVHCTTVPLLCWLASLCRTLRGWVGRENRGPNRVHYITRSTRPLRETLKNMGRTGWGYVEVADSPTHWASLKYWSTTIVLASMILAIITFAPLPLERVYPELATPLFEDIDTMCTHPLPF